MKAPEGPADGALEVDVLVWVASNWLDLGVVETDSRVSRTSTWGGGNGVTVIYGVAAPVQRRYGPSAAGLMCNV